MSKQEGRPTIIIREDNQKSDVKPPRQEHKPDRPKPISPPPKKKD